MILCINNRNGHWCQGHFPFATENEHVDSELTLSYRKPPSLSHTPSQKVRTESDLDKKRNQISRLANPTLETLLWRLHRGKIFILFANAIFDSRHKTT